MAISQQRAQELVAYYQEIKECILEVDHKYSLTEYEVDLGFPETLGLQKISFVPRTEEQIAAQANAEAQERCSAKQASIEKTFANTRASIAQQQFAADESHRQKVAQIASDYAKNCKDYRHKAVNVNLLYSTIFEKAMADFLESHNVALDEQTTRYEAQNAAFAQKEEDARQTYEQQLALLAEQREVISQNVAERLREKDESQAIAVQKYNNNVDEKEQKYQYSCKRATEYAIQAERDRALAAARLYAQLGETGLSQRKKLDKLQVAKRMLVKLYQEEAQFIMSLDGFLRSELQEYYSTLEDYINMTA